MGRRIWLLAIAASGCLAKPDRPSSGCWDIQPTPFSLVFDMPTRQSTAPWLEGNIVWYTLLWDPTYDYDLRRSSYSAGAWTEPERPLLPDGTTPFGSNEREQDPFLDDRGVMWFSANTIDSNAQKIYESQTNDLTFQQRIAHDELRSRSGAPMQPSLTPDGLTIYYSADGSAISRATRSVPTGSFQPPDELAAPHHIESPSIAADGVTILFTDHHDYGNQAKDTSRIAQGTVAGGAITNIELVGEFQNRIDWSYADPHLSRDGSTLAFTITDENKMSQIFYVNACGL